MLNSIVGPAVKGVADFSSKSSQSKDKKSTGSDSFVKVFEEKSSSAPPKEREKLAPEPLKAESPPPVTEKQKPPESERKEPDVEAIKDSGPEKSDSVGQKVKGSSQREQAILKFMDSFESEFGVPPTKIVEAMANLKLNEQAQSPEETADHVIDQLHLEDKDKDPAKSMYIGLLAQLGQMEKPAAKPDLTLMPAKTLGRFQEVQDQRGVLNSSLQSMNEKFWMNGKADVSQDTANPNQAAQLNQAAGAEFGGSELQQQIQANPDFKIDPSKLNPDMQRALQAVKEANPTASPEVALAALVAAARAAKAKAPGSDLAQMSEDSESAPGDAAKVVVGKAANGSQALAEGGQADVVVGVDAGAAGRQRGFQPGQQQAGQQQQEGLTAKTTKGEVSAKDKSSKSSEFDSSLRAQGVGPAPLKDLGVPSAPVGLIANTGNAAAKSEEKADIRQIMNQAQYLIKKGGGEMKVEMTPEGMGKIHMKVLVENGKVNVQMSAETAEAKKAIEGGLSELKNSLAAHRLSMDHIKVDVVGATNTENTAQNQMNQNQNPREQSRQFWNHFSQDFGSPSQQRESFNDMPSLRGYARPRTDQPLEPIRTARADSYGIVGKGKGLNLVA